MNIGHDNKSALLDDQVMEQAAGWKVRLLAADMSASEQDAFEKWLRDNPDHWAEFAAMDDMWERFEILKQHPVVMQELASVKPVRFASVPAIGLLSSWIYGKPRFALAILVCFLTLLPITWVVMNTGGRHAGSDAAMTKELSQTYRTVAGEQLQLELSDGSAVNLNTSTTVTVELSETRREVELVSGQAIFSVEHDPLRPFIVSSGDISVEAIGTEFEVFRNGDELQVSVVEGIVHVRHAGEDTGGIDNVDERLHRGQQITLANVSYVREVKSLDVSYIGAWRFGKLIFESTPLEDAVADFNRYSKTKIAIADPLLKDIRVSGVFRNDDSMEFVTALSDRFPVKFLNIPNGDIALVPATVNQATAH